MDIRLAGTVNDSIVDGPGLRFTIFTQGCPHHCVGCHNPNTHPVDGGEVKDTDEIIKTFSKNPLLSGITLSGGEPFVQAEACLKLAKAAHEMHMNVWAYTGFLYDHLMSSQLPYAKELVQEIDVLVDGPFIFSEKSLGLSYCGSRNQRLIDVQKTIKANQIVLWEKEKW